MEDDAKKWLQEKVETFLRKVGLSQGQTVLDFGCNEGKYTMAAARIVGQRGKVYALDKEKKVLNKLMRRARKKKLQNIQRLYIREDQQIPLKPHSVDVVLLYDTLHGGYFPEVTQRKRALRRIYRILKGPGLLSCFPTHLKGYGMTFKKQLKEISDVGFCLDDEHRRILIHDDRLIRGRIFGFKKCFLRRSSCDKD